MVLQRLAYLATSQQKRGPQKLQTQFHKYRMPYSAKYLVQRMCQDFFFDFDGGLPFLSLEILL
jgi:hypothetical protein